VSFAGHASGMFPATVAGVLVCLLYSGGFFNGTGREAFYSKKRKRKHFGTLGIFLREESRSITEFTRNTKHSKHNRN
jgi:hypothetical protein